MGRMNVKRFFIQITGIIFLGGGISAEAQHFTHRQSRLGYEHPSQDIRSIQRLVEEGLEASEDWRFTYATYKFKTARIQSDGLARSVARARLLEALDLVIDKLEDYRLSNFEKERIVEDCGRVMLSSLHEISRGGFGHDGGLDRYLSRADQLVSASDRRDFRRAEEISRDLRGDLRTFDRDVDIQDAIHALQTIEDKLSDYRLTIFEKQDVVRDCIKVFQAALERSEVFQPRGGGYTRPEPRVEESLRGLIKAMDEVIDLVEERDTDVAIRVLERMNRVLRDYDTRADQELRRAEEALRTSEDKLRDRYLSHREKVDVIRDCGRVFQDALRRSESYRLEDRNYNGVAGIVLGETEHFSKSRYETRRIRVNALQSFGALRLKALDDGLTISELTIHFENGSRLQIQEISLYEKQSSIVRLRGLRRIKEIEVTAVSSVFWGTKAKLQVSGLH